MQAIANHIQQTQGVLRPLKENLHATQNKMKQQADKKKNELAFKPSDWVFFKLHPYNHTSLKRGGQYKLESRFYGPYKVLQKIGEVA